MLKSTLKSIFLFCIIVVESTSGEPKKSNIKMLNLQKCDADGPAPIEWSIKADNADDEGHKIVDLEIDLTGGQFNDELEYSLDIDKLSGGDWEKDVFNDEGNLCDLIKAYVPKAWEKMIGLLEPTPISLCNAQRAIFKLKHFEVMKQDLQIPPLYGKLKATLKLYNKNNENLFCGLFELEITEE
ncbi:uncharacterized protein LOC126739920 [Anthonomus grandis grandis]|uniref:uncharacterized protein LOC126739920 n=1 Tax=Anthonomus grandis grandis TaxID=2921223 RepID=UPI0021659919|nr:uncharacterized protein LOC126739920 [Anthonomus grandis grandis]